MQETGEKRRWGVNKVPGQKLFQGQPLANFMEKMYIYNYRTFDKRIEAGVPLISAAILTDDNENYRPNEYVLNFCGFELRMKIPIVKIIDFKLQKELREKLETSTNPMAKEEIKK